MLASVHAALRKQNQTMSCSLGFSFLIVKIHVWIKWRSVHLLHHILRAHVVDIGGETKVCVTCDPSVNVQGRFSSLQFEQVPVEGSKSYFPPTTRRC